MTKQRNKNQAPHTQQTLWDFAGTFDELDDGQKENVKNLEGNKDHRDTLAEFRSDQMFALAAKACLEMLECNDLEIRMVAVREIFKLRAVTFKSNKRQKTEEKKIAAIQDGFQFASGN